MKRAGHGGALVLSAWLAFVPMAAADDAARFAAGVQAYLQGEFQNALGHWQPMAAAGDPVAMYHVGMVYLQTPDDPADTQVAMRWLQRAAEAGYAAAQYEFGLGLSAGNGVPLAPALAVQWWRQAAEQGHVRSQYRLARALLQGEGVATSPGQARIWFARAAEAGDRRAAEALSRLEAAAVGDGTGETLSATGPAAEPESPLRREGWLQEQAPDAFAIQLFASEREAEARAFIADNGLVGDAFYYQSTDPARPWFKVLTGVHASRGEAEAALEVLPASLRIHVPWIRSYGGIQRELRDDSPADRPVVAMTELAAVSAELQSPDPSELSLSPAPRVGSALTSNQAAALRRGQSAFNRNDYAAALREWRPLAEQGVAEAQYNLGFMHESGWGVATDFAAAYHWYEAAARQGHTRAQFNLGLLYLSGDGVRADRGLGLYWVQTAADADDARAAEYLDRMRQEQRAER